MGTSLLRRIERHTSKPSMPGNMMSISTTSAGSREKLSRATSPLSASVTSQPSSSSARRTAVRIRSSSSTVSIRVPTHPWCLRRYRRVCHSLRAAPERARMGSSSTHESADRQCRVAVVSRSARRVGCCEKRPLARIAAGQVREPTREIDTQALALAQCRDPRIGEVDDRSQVHGHAVDLLVGRRASMLQQGGRQSRRRERLRRRPGCSRRSSPNERAADRRWAADRARARL